MEDLEQRSENSSLNEFKELIAGTTKVFLKNSLNVFGETLKFGAMAGAGVVTFSAGYVRSTVALHTLPYFIRRNKLIPEDKTDKEISLDWFYCMGSFLGYFPGSISDLAFYIEMSKEHPYFFTIPIATNIMSGLYESYVYSKESFKKIKNKS